MSKRCIILVFIAEVAQVVLRDAVQSRARSSSQSEDAVAEHGKAPGVGAVRVLSTGTGNGEEQQDR